MATAEVLDYRERKRRERLRTAWERRHTGPIKAAFLTAYGVKAYRYGYRNLRSLLEQGGAGREAADRVMAGPFGTTEKSMTWIRDPYGRGDVFDHFEFYGRARTPLFLIGHPYNIRLDEDGEPYVSDDAAVTIEAIRALGLTVTVLAQRHSWYGYGTAHVAVYHLPTVRAVCGPDAPAWPSLRPPRREPWPGLGEAERILASTHPHLMPNTSIAAGDLHGELEAASLE